MFSSSYPGECPASIPILNTSIRTCRVVRLIASNMNGVTFDVLNKNKTLLLKKGFLPIPAHPDQKHPLGKWKSYTVSDWNKSLKFVPGVRSNIGIITGQKSGILCVDVDNKKPEHVADNHEIYSQNTGTQDWELLCAQHGGSPKTLSCISPSGGKHYYFMWDDVLASKVKTTNACVMSVEGRLCAIDIRGNGGFIMCPPSVTSAGSYVWQPSDKICEIPILPLPDWIRDNIVSTCEKATQKQDSVTRRISCKTLCDNDVVDNEDFELFRQSRYFKNHHLVKIDHHQRIILQETEDFDCEICKRRHVKHSNHPFLVRRESNLLFVCRPSSGDKHFTALVTPHSEEEASEEKDTPHYTLMKELWNVAAKEKLKKCNGHIYRPIPKKPCAYRRSEDYKQFINKVLKKNKTFKSSPKRFADLMSHLDLYDDPELPFMERDMNILAFQNGVLMLDTLEFLDYGKQTKDKVARHFIDQTFVGKTYTPAFDKLVMHQMSHLEEQERGKVYDMLLALIGRSFFKTGQHDKFTILLFFYGDSNTGKSTMLHIIEAMHPPNAVGVISANNEKTFGLEGLMDKDVIVIPEMPHNMRDVLDCTVLQQMIDGDVVTVPVKNRKTTYGNFHPPIVAAGNKFPNYEDKKGALPKRFSTIHFFNYIVDRDNTLEKKIIENELSNLIYKSLLAYWKVVKENVGKDFWDFAPDYFHDTKELARSATNWLHRFLTTYPDDNKSTTAKYYCRKRVLEGEHRIRTSINDVKKAFTNYMKFNHPGEKIVWDDGDHSTFKSLGYEVEEVNMCRSCRKKAKGGKEPCCAEYSKANRSKRTFVCDLEIVCEAIQPPTYAADCSEVDAVDVLREAKKEMMQKMWG